MILTRDQDNVEQRFQAKLMILQLGSRIERSLQKF